MFYSPIYETIDRNSQAFSAEFGGSPSASFRSPHGRIRSDIGWRCGASATVGTQYLAKYPYQPCLSLYHPRSHSFQAPLGMVPNPASQSESKKEGLPVLAPDSHYTSCIRRVCNHQQDACIRLHTCRFWLSLPHRRCLPFLCEAYSEVESFTQQGST